MTNIYTLSIQANLVGFPYTTNNRDKVQVFKKPYGKRIGIDQMRLLHNYLS